MTQIRKGKCTFKFINYFIGKIDMTSNQELHWYALSIYGNKVFAAEAVLQDLGLETYVPVVINFKPRQGSTPEEVRMPAVSRLMFVRARIPQLLDIEQRGILPLRIYRTLESNPAERKPIVIPDAEMQTFILVSSCGEKGLEYFAGGEMQFRPGSKVRVIQGPFKGSIGHIKRIRGNRRLVVEIQGICAVATSYIPTPFLERLPD